MILAWILPRLFDALDWLKFATRYLVAHPMAAVALLLAIVAGVKHHEAGKWATVAKQRGDAIHAAQDASKAELARANAEHAAALKKQKDDDDATDRRVADAGAADAARLGAYIVRLRASLHQDHGSAVSAPGQADLASDGNGPGSPAVVVQALTDDLGICDANTRRLLEIHNEAVN